MNVENAIALLNSIKEFRVYDKLPFNTVDYMNIDAVIDLLERLQTERRKIANSIKLPLINGEAPDNLADHIELLMLQEYYPMLKKLDRMGSK